jgi:hypothetical protein
MEASALRNLGVPANMIATELGNVSSFVNDPQKLKQWAFDHISRNMSVAEQLQSSGMGNRNVLPGSVQFDPKSIAGQEQFNKQAVMVAQQQFQALGGTGTNDQLGSAMKTSPNAALSEMGNRGIIQLLKGNEDAIDAKNQAWQKWKQQHGADTYDTFSTKFNQVYNPLVFQVQYMGPDEIANLQKKLSPKDAQKFAQSYAVAKAQGWIGGGNGGQQ